MKNYSLALFFGLFVSMASFAGGSPAENCFQYCKAHGGYVGAYCPSNNACACFNSQEIGANFCALGCPGEKPGQIFGPNHVGCAVGPIEVGGKTLPYELPN